MWQLEPWNRTSYLFQKVLVCELKWNWIWNFKVYIVCIEKSILSRSAVGVDRKESSSFPFIYNCALSYSVFLQVSCSKFEDICHANETSPVYNIEISLPTWKFKCFDTENFYFMVRVYMSFFYIIFLSPVYIFFVIQDLHWIQNVVKIVEKVELYFNNTRFC